MPDTLLPFEVWKAWNNGDFYRVFCKYHFQLLQNADKALDLVITIVTESKNINPVDF